MQHSAASDDAVSGTLHALPGESPSAHQCDGPGLDGDVPGSPTDGNRTASDARGVTLCTGGADDGLHAGQRGGVLGSPCWRVQQMIAERRGLKTCIAQPGADASI